MISLFHYRVLGFFPERNKAAKPFQFYEGKNISRRLEINSKIVFYHSEELDYNEGNTTKVLKCGRGPRSSFDAALRSYLSP